MLAVRYLNPLRTHFSIITLICLLGVSLGVMVLIVVLSVMGGLQKEIRDRILAQTPHILVQYAPNKSSLQSIEDWQPLVEKLESLPGVQTAYAQIEDYALVDSSGAQRPGFFRAIDTQNSRQMDELAKLPVDGSFELGFEDEVVVSSKFAQDMMIAPGQKLRIYSTRNFDPLLKIYRQSENPPLKQHASFAPFAKLLSASSRPDSKDAPDAKDTPDSKDDRDAKDSPDAPAADSDHANDSANDSNSALPDPLVLAAKDFNALSAAIADLAKAPHRDAESPLIERIDASLAQATPSGEDSFTLSQPNTAILLDAIAALDNLESDQADLEAFRDVKSLVLPKDMLVKGVYQASSHIITPDLFMPLTSAQEILETGGGVHGIALRLDQPYTAHEQVAGIASALPEGYVVTPWNQRFEEWFRLINQERMMMTFVLSFIVLIAGFCIMAVMFTVTVQRKREIAVMMALGATPAKVVRIFLWQGLIIGFLGSALGVALGLLVIHYRMEIQQFLKLLNFDPFPKSFHGVSLPAIVNPVEIAWVSTGAFIMVTLVAIIPALFAAFQDPAKSLRSL